MFMFFTFTSPKNFVLFECAVYMNGTARRILDFDGLPTSLEEDSGGLGQQTVPVRTVVHYFCSQFSIIPQPSAVNGLEAELTLIPMQ